MSINSVFVYGTLKPGLRYYSIAQSGGKFQQKEGYVDGFDLYHLNPENYPVAIRGNGRIYGWIYTYENIDFALQSLDDLEDIYSDPPLYERVNCFTNTNEQVWIYLGLDFDRYLSYHNAEKIEDGIWNPK